MLLIYQTMVSGCNRNEEVVGFALGGGEAIGIFHHSGPTLSYTSHQRHPESDPASGGKSWTPGTTGTALTGSQQVQLQQIRDRDAEFDQDLDEIGEGIQDLHELAQRQGEEVQRQNIMLQNTQNKLDSAHEHMTNVNAKMKDTLNEVGRSSDKLCVDIMCIVSAAV